MCDPDLLDPGGRVPDDVHPEGDIYATGGRLEAGDGRGSGLSGVADVVAVEEAQAEAAEAPEGGVGIPDGRDLVLGWGDEEPRGAAGQCVVTWAVTRMRSPLVRALPAST